MKQSLKINQEQTFLVTVSDIVNYYELVHICRTLLEILTFITALT